jgi:probable HAF family extracellular repeat protein
MIRRWLATVLTAFSLSQPSLAHAQTLYKLIDLGQVDGVGSFAVGINDNGQVAGFLITATHDSRAVVSVNGQPFAYVTALQSLEVGLEGIGPFGDVTGHVVVSTPPSPFAYHAIRYSEQGGLVDLGTLGGLSSTGISINSHQQVAGWSYNASGIPRAFRSTPGQPLQELPLLGGSTSQSFAGAINEAGQVSGNAEDSTGHWHGFRFTDGQPLLDLGALGPNAVRGLNNAGQVVGVLGYAFRYTDGIGIENLAPQLTFGSGGNSINDAGDVAGYVVQGNGIHHAARYTDQDGMVDLNDFIDPSSGWVLTDALDINNSGQIVGIGSFNGQQFPRAFLLTPIVPDVIPPIIAAAEANPAELWPANHKMIPVNVTVAVSDDVDPAPTCRITSIVSSEASAGTVDFQILSSLSAELRAESLGQAGRLYSMTVECADASANTASTVVNVRVPHDRSGK